MARSRRSREVRVEQVDGEERRSASEKTDVRVGYGPPRLDFVGVEEEDGVVELGETMAASGMTPVACSMAGGGGDRLGCSWSCARSGGRERERESNKVERRGRGEASSGMALSIPGAPSNGGKHDGNGWLGFSHGDNRRLQHTNLGAEASADVARCEARL